MGFVRRNALTPLADVGSLEALNRNILLPWCEHNARTHGVPHTTETVAEVYARERAVLHPLPAAPFEACRVQAATVSKMSTVMFGTNQYSVPSRYAGQAVWVKGFVDRVVVVAQNGVIAEHPRCAGREQMVLELDHYLDVLLQKPRAVRDARVMQGQRVPDVARRIHARMRERQDAQGDRLFVRFLLQHRELGMEGLRPILEEAKQSATVHYEGLMAIAARHLGEHPAPVLTGEKIPVELADLRVRRQDLRQYDQLTRGGTLS